MSSSDDHTDPAPDRPALGMQHDPEHLDRHAPDLLRVAAMMHGDAPALVTPHGIVTWSGLDHRVDHVVGRLAAAGVEPGDRLAFVLRNPDQAIVLVLAGLRGGAMVVPLSPRLPDAGVRETCATLGDPVLFTANHGPFDPALLVDSLYDRPHPPRVRPAVPPPGGHAAGNAVHACTGVQTSGSTGEPRVVVHRLHAHVASAAGAVRKHGFTTTGRWLMSLPLHHVGGLAVLFRALVSGGAMVLAESGESVPAVCTRFGVTHCSLVSTQLVRALNEGTPIPVALHTVLMGGGPLSPELLREAAGRGWPIRASYGLTEAASLVTSTTGDDPAPDTAGRVLPGRRVEVDARGHILVGGPVLAEGTVRDGILSPLNLVDGLYDTGDLGSMQDGRLVVAGRADSRFVSGGENIQPESVERVLITQPGVRQVVVVPIPDAEFVARPFAWIDGEIDPERLDTAVRARLPGFMAPVSYRQIPSEYLDTTLKPSRKRLADLAATESGRQGLIVDAGMT